MTDSKRWPTRIFHPSPRAPPIQKWRNDAIPRERGSRRAPERYAPATFFLPADAPGRGGGVADRPSPRSSPLPRAPRRALRTRAGTFNRTSRGRNARLDEHRADPPPPPRTAPPRRRPVARGGPGGGRGQRRTSPGARSCGWGLDGGGPAGAPRGPLRAPS